MDKVKDRTYPLHAMDISLCFANIPYIYYFRGDIPLDMLQKSFYQTINNDFLILLGHVTMDTQGSGKVTVDQDNLNMPEYQESISDLDFDELKDANFSWDKWPKNLALCGYTTTAGKDGHIKLANVHAIQLKGRSGIALFVNIPHYVMDGIGYSLFMSRWSEVFQQLSESKPIESVGYSHNRGEINQSLDGITLRDVDPMTRVPFSCRNWLSRWLGWISPETRGTVLSTASWMNIVAHTFRIPADKLPKQQGLSDNDMLTSLASLALSQCFDDPQKESMVTVAIDMRYRLSNTLLVDKKYAGNCMLSRTLKFCSTETLNEVAAKIRRAVNDTDPGFAAGYVSMLEQDPLCFTCPLVYGLSNPNCIIVSNQSRFPLYQCQFGASRPEWISLIPRFYKTFVSILPQKDPSCYHFYISTGPSTMGRLLQHTLWNSYSNLVY